MGLFKLDSFIDRSVLVAVNRKGRARVLFYEDHAEEAEAIRARVEAELIELGRDAWCERYHVPLDFYRGSR